MAQLEPFSIENLDFSIMSVAAAFNANEIFNTTSKATYILTFAIVLLLLREFKRRSTHKVSSMDTIPWIKPSLPWIGPLHFFQNRDGNNFIFERLAKKYLR